MKTRFDSEENSSHFELAENRIPPQTAQLGEAASKVHYVQQVARSLEESILNELRSIVRPIADNLVGIRENLNKVKTKTQELQKSFRSDSDGFGAAVWRFSEESKEIQKYAEGMEQTVLQGEKNQSEITKQIVSASEASERIQDIAERIKLLSINASVVAARVGSQGREFSIIAQEVRRLAEDTESSSKQINDSMNKTLKNSTIFFEKFVTQLREKSNQMRDIRSSTVNLENFLRNFKGLIDLIFQDFDDFSGQLESDLETISPTLQQNEIAMQQIENTGKSVDENILLIFAEDPSIESEISTPEKKILLDTFLRHLTTRLEEKTVQEWLQRCGLSKSSEVSKETEGEIVLF